MKNWLKVFVVAVCLGFIAYITNYLQSIKVVDTVEVEMKVDCAYMTSYYNGYGILHTVPVVQLSSEDGTYTTINTESVWGQCKDHIGEKVTILCDVYSIAGMEHTDNWRLKFSWNDSGNTYDITELSLSPEDDLSRSRKSMTADFYTPSGVALGGE